MRTDGREAVDEYVRELREARLSLADALRDAVQAGGRWDDVAREVERLTIAKLRAEVERLLKEVAEQKEALAESEILITQWYNAYKAALAD